MSSNTKPHALIRSMSLADLSQVNHIEQTTHEFPWTEGIIRDCIQVGYLCLVIEVDHTIVGYAICRLDHSTELFNITIQTASQGHGYGRELMVYVLKIAKARGSHEFLLEVRQSNTTAIKLYESLGFTQSGIRKDYYEAVDGKEDALVFRLELNPL